MGTLHYFPFKDRRLDSEIARVLSDYDPIGLLFEGTNALLEYSSEIPLIRSAVRQSRSASELTKRVHAIFLEGFPRDRVLVGSGDKYKSMTKELMGLQRL